MSLEKEGILKNPEKRAKLLVLLWLVSILMIIFGYIVIFYILFLKK
jgi:hypothetical protein